MNSMKKLVASLLLLTISGHVAAQWSLDVAVKKNGKGNSLILDMTLTHQGDVAVETYASSLPWGIRQQLALVVAPLAEYPPAFKPALYIDDLRNDPITIKPGEVLHGQVDLNERFSELESYTGKDPLVICYRYMFGEIDHGNPDSAEGCRIVYLAE